MFKFHDIHENDCGWTPLRCAALSGNEYIVRELISLGVDVNAPFLEDLEDTWISVNGIKGVNIICDTATMCHTPRHVRILDTLHVEGKAKVKQNNFDVLICSLFQRTLKGQVNYAAEWVLDTFPQWDVNEVIGGHRGTNNNTDNYNNFIIQ